MGKAVVSTSLGAEGLAVKDGVHLLLADAPALFAERTIELLGSSEHRRVLGEAGRKLVKGRYDWDHIALCLEAAWKAACQGGDRVEAAARVPLEVVKAGA